MNYDPTKREINLAKHGIDLIDCPAVFDYPMLTQQDNRITYGEERLISLGWLNGKVILMVWVDETEQGPRYISCREAQRHEQKVYFSAYPDF